MYIVIIMTSVTKIQIHKCITWYYSGIDDSSVISSDLEAASRYRDFDNEEFDGLDATAGEDEIGKVPSADTKGSKEKPPRYGTYYIMLCVKH